MKTNHHRQLHVVFDDQVYNIYEYPQVQCCLPHWICSVMFKRVFEFRFSVSQSLSLYITCAVIYLWPVGCSEHVSSSLERMRGVVVDSILSHMNVLCFILCCAQWCHAVLIEALYTCCYRHWQRDKRERQTLISNAVWQYYIIIQFE